MVMSAAPERAPSISSCWSETGKTPPPGNGRSDLRERANLRADRTNPVSQHKIPAMRAVLTCVLLLAGRAAAQPERFVAYPQDTVTHSSGGAVMSGTPVPLGGFILHGGTSLEGRWQQLIESKYLPTI